MTDFYYQHLTTLFIVTIAIPLSVCAWHFFMIGPKGKRLAMLPQTVQRFGLLHRLVHILRALAFILAGFTGYWLA